MLFYQRSGLRRGRGRDSRRFQSLEEHVEVNPMFSWAYAHAQQEEKAIERLNAPHTRDKTVRLLRRFSATLLSVKRLGRRMIRKEFAQQLPRRSPERDSQADAAATDAVPQEVLSAAARGSREELPYTTRRSRVTILMRESRESRYSQDSAE